MLKQFNKTQGVPAEENDFSNVISDTLESLGFTFSQFYNVKAMRGEVLLHIVLGKLYYMDEYPERCVIVMDDNTFSVTKSHEISGAVEVETDYESIISKLVNGGYHNLERKVKLKKFLQ